MYTTGAHVLYSGCSRDLSIDLVLRNFSWASTHNNSGRIMFITPLHSRYSGCEGGRVLLRMCTATTLHFPYPQCPMGNCILGTYLALPRWRGALCIWQLKAFATLHGTCTVLNWTVQLCGQCQTSLCLPRYLPRCTCTLGCFSPVSSPTFVCIRIPSSSCTYYLRFAPFISCSVRPHIRTFLPFLCHSPTSI